MFQQNHQSDNLCAVREGHLIQLLRLLWSPQRKQNLIFIHRLLYFLLKNPPSEGGDRCIYKLAHGHVVLMYHYTAC